MVSLKKGKACYLAEHTFQEGNDSNYVSEKNYCNLRFRDTTTRAVYEINTNSHISI